MIIRSTLTTCITLFCTLFAAAQVQFIDKTTHYNIAHTYGNGTAGGGISLVDFTGDGLDDLTLASSDGNSIYFYKNIGNGVQKLDLLPDFIEEVKHILWVDYDNDGDKDLFVSLADNYNRLFRNEGGLSLIDVTLAVGLPQNVYTSFGACWGDYDRDGWLDLYFGLRRIEADEQPNISKLYKNNGGTFVDVTLSTATEDGGKTPFCSSFIDFNNDKWPDIYTAHDRKRGNTFLLNNGDGTFTDSSAATDSDLMMDGMSVSTSDYNQDGYQDIYVSNSEVGNAFFVNQGGTTFKNLAGEKGIGFFSVAWGTNFLDGDNDGDDDLYVSGMLPGKDALNSQYFANQFPQDTFIYGAKIESDTVSSFNNAIGDINNDGYPDIGVINVGPYPSFVFENIGGENHFIKIKLQGVLSNKDGIGSTLLLYSGGNRQLKYTQCGIGFMGQNSDTQIFGLGQQTSIDSLIVIWPTGHKDIFRSLDIDKKHILTEGISTGGTINVDADVKLYVSTNEITVNDKNNQILVYPNPSYRSLIKVKNTMGNPIKAIDLLDYSFAHIKHISGIHNTEYLLDITDVPASKYIIKVVSENGDVSYSTHIKIQ